MRDVSTNLVALRIAAALSAATFDAASSVMVALTSAFGALLLVPMVALGIKGERKARFLRFAWATLTGPPTLLTVGSFYGALQHSPAVIANPLVATYPLGSILLARLFLGRPESFSPSIIIGALLVVGGSACQHRRVQ